MKLTGGRLFVITAGMMSEHTASHDLALRMIGDERQAIFFVGYADPDTPGGRLKPATPASLSSFSPGAGEVTRRCEWRTSISPPTPTATTCWTSSAKSSRASSCSATAKMIRAWFAEQIHARYPKIKDPSSPNRAKRWRCIPME